MSTTAKTVVLYVVNYRYYNESHKYGKSHRSQISNLISLRLKNSVILATFCFLSAH